MTKCAHTFRDAACLMAKARIPRSHQRWRLILQSCHRAAGSCQRHLQICPSACHSRLQIRRHWKRRSQTLAQRPVTSLVSHPSPTWLVLVTCLHKSGGDRCPTDLARPRSSHTTLGLQMSDRSKTSSEKSSSSKRSGGSGLFDATKPELALLSSK